MVDDLVRMAGVLGLWVSREDLERWAPLLQSLFADLDRMIDMPIDDQEPAGMTGPLIAASPGRVR